MEVAAFQRAWLAAHTVQVFEQRLLVLLAEQPQAACLQKLIEKMGQFLLLVIFLQSFLTLCFADSIVLTILSHRPSALVRSSPTTTQYKGKFEC